jgi:hypothetical protein
MATHHPFSLRRMFFNLPAGQFENHFDYAIALLTWPFVILIMVPSALILALLLLSQGTGSISSWWRVLALVTCIALPTIVWRGLRARWHKQVRAVAFKHFVRAFLSGPH